MKIVIVCFFVCRVSVSRAIRPFGNPGRPDDWFSQKVCFCIFLICFFIFNLAVFIVSSYFNVYVLVHACGFLQVFSSDSSPLISVCQLLVIQPLSVYSPPICDAIQPSSYRSSTRPITFHCSKPQCL